MTIIPCHSTLRVHHYFSSYTSISVVGNLGLNRTSFPILNKLIIHLTEKCWLNSVADFGLNELSQRHEGMWGSGCTDTYFLDLGTSWRLVFSCRHRPFCHRGKSPRYPLDRRLGGLQTRSGRRGEEKFLTLPGLELRPLGHPARSQSLYRLCYPGS
jgi:hypothetical protein